MSRLNIQKTYKLFIDDKFPRTESGRFYTINSDKGELIANMSLASRKDVCNSFVAARKAQAGWTSKTAYNRSQILYRLAEMLETRSTSFIEEMMLLGLSKKQAELEVEGLIDRLVYYAGWCDKYTALFSLVNPTATSHFNFSVHEATGFVAAIAPESSPLLGLISVIAPVITGGNSVIAVASETKATSAISFAEVVQNSDVPVGVINIVTGSAFELVPHMAWHLDVNSLVDARGEMKAAELDITNNVKRYFDWTSKVNGQDPYMILDCQEVKTTWHPEQTSAEISAGY